MNGRKRVELIHLSAEEAKLPRWSDRYFSNNTELEILTKIAAMHAKKPGFIPMVLDRIPKGLLDLSTHSFSFSGDKTWTEIISKIKHGWDLKDSQMGLVFYVIDHKGKYHTMNGSMLMKEVWQEFKGENGVLRVEFSRESMFG